MSSNTIDPVIATLFPALLLITVVLLLLFLTAPPLQPPPPQQDFNIDNLIAAKFTELFCNN